MRTIAEEIARCDREIADIETNPVGTPIGILLGSLDWQAEKAVLETLAKDER